MSIKITTQFFTEIFKNNLKHHTETKNLLLCKRKSTLKRKIASRGITIQNFKLYYRVIKTILVLA